MKKLIFVLTTASIVLLGALQLKSQKRMLEQNEKVWQAFEMQDLQNQLKQSGKPWLPFLDVSTLNCGLYSLAKGATDHQSPHEQDEVYYVLEGSATLEVGEEKIVAKEGSVIFVKARAPHRFVDIEKDLKVLVFFSTAESK
ncbi:cupin domain-containing protein [Fulvivirgaceae bacterium BMA12]|uniref:Cupin domain-containing protein n=1 Tax=Agaribacillus aureus TaxID=3051825 RepID=A0ABT8LC55_9BACT|nr:cupin domain-containing protein [Fulvivirgaceae bacterium BMA12]